MNKSRSEPACPSVPIDPLVGLSEEQKQMLEKHGTPADFAVACYRAVPDFISMDEAKHAVDEYTAEWSACASVTPNTQVQAAPGSLGVAPGTES